MKNQKLFSKIFLYTFMVMFFVTVIAHVCLYFLAPQMTLSTNSFLGGAIIESDINTGLLIKSAISKALPMSLLGCTIISLICSLIFSKAMSKPIKQISETTEKMEQMDKTARCTVDTNDEIGLQQQRSCTFLSIYKKNVRSIHQRKILKKSYPMYFPMRFLIRIQDTG